MYQGILFAGRTDNRRFYFSPVEYIERELGPLKFYL